MKSNPFIRALEYAGKVIPFSWLRRSMGQRLITPFYHTVSDRELPHIKHLYPVRSARQFEKDLDFLLKYYTPIDFHELGELIERRSKRIGKAPMLLSFDDGLREFHDVVAPALLRKGVPAICFLNSAFIDNKDLFFRYKASLLITHITEQGLEEAAFNTLKINAINLKNGHALPEFLLSLRYDNRQMLDTLADSVGLDFNAFLQKQQPYLNSAQVESLLQNGFHFGAHSVDHPEYRFLPYEEQLRQTVASIETVSNRFGLGYRLFSFPFTDFGVEARFFNFILEEKKAAEYTFGCAGLKKDVHPRHIQRIPMEVSNLAAEEVLQRAFFFYWLKAAAGKNRIRRK